MTAQLTAKADYHTVSADEAAAAVRDGDLIYVSLVHMESVLDAITARRDLSHVDVRLTTPLQDPGWLRPEPGDRRFSPEFQIFIGDVGRPSHDTKLTSYIPHLFSTEFKQLERPLECRFPEVFVTRVSRPDVHGYVNFGPNPFNKRRYVRSCRTVIAEIDETFPRLYGDCQVHVSEIDYLVEPPGPPSEATVRDRLAAIDDPERRARLTALFESSPRHWLRPYLGRFHLLDPEVAARLLGRFAAPDAATLAIAANLASMVGDGAVLQIGVGEPSGSMFLAGAFDHVRNLGLHTEMCAPGWSRLARTGVMTNADKRFRPGVAVAGGWAGSTPEDLDFVADNPGCELQPTDVVLDPRLMASIDRVHAVNSAINIDLMGQINAESVFGPRMINGTGGQPDAHISALYSKGGRAITTMTSTALGGAVSRIVPLHEAGTTVTIPRYFADTVITEFGVARLYGKSSRERARELIAVAHPDFRADLRRSAEEIFGLRP